MRQLILIAVLLAALAAAPSALGKEVLAVTACGSDGCSTSRDAGLMRGMTDVGPPTDAPAGPGRFYRLTITVGDGDEVAGHDRLWWVPAAGVLLTRDGTWLAARSEIRSGLHELTRGLDPLPAGRLPVVPEAPDAAPPAQAPAARSPSAQDDSPVWIVVAAATALLIGGLLVLSQRITSRPSGALHSPD
jgi:hypothetical protein